MSVLTSFYLSSTIMIMYDNNNYHKSKYITVPYYVHKIAQ